MEQARKNLLSFGFVREYCNDNNIELLPSDIIELLVLWLSFRDQFDISLSHKDIAIETKTDDKYGEYQEIRKSKASGFCITAICKNIIKKGHKQSWKFQLRTKDPDSPPMALVFGIIDNKIAESNASQITDFSSILGG